MTLYDELRQQANKLTPEEQLRLIAELAEQVRRNKPQAATLYYWHDLQGVGQHSLTGEDAQTWVTRSRQEIFEDGHLGQLMIEVENDEKLEGESARQAYQTYLAKSQK